MLLAIGIYMTVTVPFYVLTVFINSYLSKILGYEVGDALLINTVAMLVMLGIIPISAYYTDKIGRKPVLQLAATLVLLCAYPLFYATANAGFTGALLAQCAMAFIVGIYIAPVPTVLVELFPTRIRYTGMAVSYNICAALFGGTAPMVSSWLIKTTENNLSVAWYLMICSAISLITLHYYKDRFREKLA